LSELSSVLQAQLFAGEELKVATRVKKIPNSKKKQEFKDEILCVSGECVPASTLNVFLFSEEKTKSEGSKGSIHSRNFFDQTILEVRGTDKGGVL
jgi:hypothetical protein